MPMIRLLPFDSTDSVSGNQHEINPGLCWLLFHVVMNWNQSFRRPKMVKDEEEPAYRRKLAKSICNPIKFKWQVFT